MLVVPVACGMQSGRSYRSVLLGAIGFALLTVAGLTLSYYTGLKPGGTIVLIGVVCFVAAVLLKRIRR